MSASLPIPLGTVVAGKYRVEQLIGQGGMGFVFAATDLALARQVALKCVRPMRGDDDVTLGRFTREARAAASLQSDHVARVFDAGTLPSGVPYIVLELLEGKSLQDIVKTHEPQPIAAVIDYVLQACDGLMEAHGRGIVHRDLKPANLFLARSPTGPPRIKVLDFGISKLLDGPESTDDFTPTGMIFGSPRYMSPEQLRSAKHVGPATDVWALGTIMYELLTGRPAFPGPSLEETVTQIRDRPPAPVRESRREVSDALAAIVKRCLEKDAKHRFPTMLALAEELAKLAPPTSTIAARFRPDPGAPAQPESNDTVDALMAQTDPVPPRSSQARRRVLVVLSFFAAIVVGGAALRFVVGPIPFGAAFRAMRTSEPPPPAPALSAPGGATETKIPPAPHDEVRLVGAVSPADRFAHEWAKAFEASHAPVRVRLEAATSSAAIDALLRGSAELAVLSRAATADERARAQVAGVRLDELAESLVVLDAVAVIVNPENPMRELTLEDLRGVFSGAITDWSHFGGKRRTITVVLRPDDLGIDEAFRASVLGAGAKYLDGAEVLRETADVAERIRRERDAISIVGLDAVGANKALRLAATSNDRAVAPSPQTVRSRAYPLVRPIFLYARGAPEGAAKAFVGYALAEGQADARKAEAVPVTIELVADREGAERASRACALPAEERRKFSSDYRFRSGALVFDELAMRDLDRMAATLCATPAAPVDLLGVLERGGGTSAATAGAKERAATVQAELALRCPALRVRCVAAANDGAKRRDEQDVGRVEVWVGAPP